MCKACRETSPGKEIGEGGCGKFVEEPKVGHPAGEVPRSMDVWMMSPALGYHHSFGHFAPFALPEIFAAPTRSQSVFDWPSSSSSIFASVMSRIT